MFSIDDTIVAIATPPGRGGIGVVRISGRQSHAIALAVSGRRRPLEPRRATLASIRNVDEVLLTYFAGPHSYTGDDVIEIGCHGSPVVTQTIVGAVQAAGARLAEPGEFTLRAFLNGRLDLVQAEAVGDLVNAATPLQARTAFDQLEGTLTARIVAIGSALFDVIARLEASLDFTEDGYHFIDPGAVHSSVTDIVAAIDALLTDARGGRTIREGATVVIAGAPNVGKSSIFNMLAGHCRAIVTAVPGTTRDLVTETVAVLGLPITLVDTAGIRDTADAIEREGVDRARRAAEVATLVLVVLDQSAPLDVDDRAMLAAIRAGTRLIVRNKIDLQPAWKADAIEDATVGVSAATGEGFGSLRAAISAHLTGRDELRDPPAISNARHIALLERAREQLARACAACASNTPAPEEFVLSDLQQARSALEEITGTRTTDDLLQHIFERFCIGK